MPRLLPCLAGLLTCLAAGTAGAATPPCEPGAVFSDLDGDGRRSPNEPGVDGVAVSDGRTLVRTDASGRYRLPVGEGGMVFVVKPPAFGLPRREDGLPAHWQDVRGSACPAFALQPAAGVARPALEVLVFGDPQPKSAVDVDYYRRDIVDPLRASGEAAGAGLGLTLGDVVHDDLSLYPAMNAVTASLGLPWLHAPGNHDLDFDSSHDIGSLATFQGHYGPDTLAWEEPEASFVVLDNVVYQPDQRPAYVGGIREDQFAFIEAYLATARRDRLLVLAAHIPFFDAVPGQETFRHGDRARLFGMLRPFPKVLLLTAHGHIQRHVWHDGESGWQGAEPLHEYNVGAACGAFWSGVKDADGIPDATMADGTPNGHARLQVFGDGRYALSWQPSRQQNTSASTAAMRLHGPRVLRRGSWPGTGLFANVYMGDAATRVEYRIDGGEWEAMRRVEVADPWLLAQNAGDDASDRLRGYDRAPEAKPSTHLWRINLPTDLAVGVHRVEVRAFDRWHGAQHASTTYRLDEASP